MHNDSSTIRCFITTEHDCSYLDSRKARNMVIDPDLPLNDALLGDLLNHGFRRSGRHIYRPQCDNCCECVSLRIPVERFRPNRSQRRNWKNNHALQHFISQNKFSDEHFQLYSKYLSSRHEGSEMSDPKKEDFISFLTAPNITTLFHEIRLDEQLLGVAVTDHTPTGLSAVYTFFDPDYGHLGLGTYAILLQIQLTRELGLPWLYLGYWIEGCKKMNYKNKFRPFEAFIDEQWQIIEN